MGLPAHAREVATTLTRYPVPRLQKLVNESSRDLFGLALRLCGDKDEAEDILQATWVNAFEALRSGDFRGDCKLETWLYRIVMQKLHSQTGL